MAGNTETVYLKIEQNVLVRDPSVVLKDIAKITSTNRPLINKMKLMKVYTFHTPINQSKKKMQTEVFSVLKIIEMIGQEFPNVEIQNIGEKDFVLEYQPKEEAKWLLYLKTAILCVLIFFGSAFTIMTFNNDVGVGEVFMDYYQQVMGTESNGFTVLEICYSIGLFFGIMVFFNHVGRKKITHDPTPIQVEMRTYEKDVDATFIENCGRNGTSNDVD
ncbi:MAG: stage V sporulation protein AA [Lachnospiraceae bacterium]|jgi:stage V sporulation protein AA|nr:stage V sporulation protein AA [Lachnospiraceae bacterium]